MCGIVGILGRQDPELAQRMASRLDHRGPDGQGTWNDDQLTLAHRRLAILDVERGQQPMESHDGRYVITYNGEIYNHPRLRHTLEEKGATFSTDNDAETILEAYRVWGEGVPGRLEGMFAFAIWDTQERTLFMARDPFGIKPFFNATVGDHWVFASEVKALLAHPEIEAKQNTERIKERICIDFLTGQGTLFEGIRQLPPGSCATMRPGDLKPEWNLYYQVPTECFLDIEDATKQVRGRIVESVQEQLLSDVPLGVVLSGGFDSTAVAAIHQGLLADQPIDTFTVAESEEVDDFREARALAEHLGTNHHEFTFELDDVIADMPRFTWHNENVNYTEFFFLPLFEGMRHTVKVGLCGQGSDEFWGGYDRYRDPNALARERLRRLRELMPAHAEELANQVAHTHITGSALAEWDQMGQLNNFQLRLVDRNSMAHSLEVRVPFLSRPLHAASRAICWGWKLPHGESPPGVATNGPPAGADGGTPETRATGGQQQAHATGGQQQAPAASPTGVEKWILRQALSDLDIPKRLLWRPKVPAGRATSPGVMDRFEAYATKLVGDRWQDHPYRKAMESPAQVLMLDLWQEIFIHREGQVGDLTLEDLA